MRQRTLFMTGAVGLIGLFCALILSGGGVSSTTAGQPDNVPSDFRPSSDATIAGQVSVSTWEIPEGVTVSVPRDLIVDCGGDIVINGRLIAEQSGSADFDNGASITLRTPGSVKLSGLIQAGNGAESPLALGSSGSIGLIGGRGGDVTIEATAVIGTGEVRAGDGGMGLLGGQGGEGGRVVIEAATASPESDSPLLAQGGTGGRGGDGVPEFNSGTGGTGGDGGDALIVPAGDGTPGDPGSDDIKTGCAANGIPWSSCGAINFHPAGYPGANAIGGDGGVGGNGTPACGHGGNGGRGGNAQSQCGGNGTWGLNCEAGGAGGNGGGGGSATGGRGGNGGNGEECCCGANGPGGNGGSGGPGGNATSGHGGNGGNGGNSTHTPIPWAGGNGGNGGNGGSATGGSGGDGGDGANGSPVGTGGSGGARGTVAVGTGGSGGNGGTGLPSGTPGTAGSTGTAIQGVAGTNGGSGAGCPLHVSEMKTVGVTSIDEQSWQSNGYSVGRQSESGCAHFCWTSNPRIPQTVDEIDRSVAYYGCYDGSSVKTVSIGSGGSSRSRHPNLAADAQNLAHVVFTQRDDAASPYEPWIASFPIHCQLDFNSSAFPPVLPPPNNEYIEPRIAASRGAGGGHVFHVISAPSPNCLPRPYAYWRYDGTLWQGPVSIDVTPGVWTRRYGYAIAADPNSDKVAVVLQTEDPPGSLLNIAYYESTTKGLGWLDDTEPLVKNLLTTYVDPATGIEAGYHISAAYDNSGNLHVVWDERQPLLGNTATILRHWSSLTDDIRPVTAALWENLASTGSFSLNLSKITLGIGDGCTSCDGGVESNRDYLYVMYTQFGGNTAIERDDYSALGYMNGELYLTVSADVGLTWAPPQNLTNTKTPQCNPGPADPVTGEPQNPSGVCQSEHWGSIGQTVGDIDILYIKDLDAGAATRGEGTWQMNSVHYRRIAGSTTNAQYVCPATGPNWYAELVRPDACPPHAPPQGVDNDGQLIVHNMGNGALTGSISVVTTVGPPGMLKINGGTVPVPLSLVPPSTVETSVSVTLSAVGIATEGIYSGIITITSNGQPSPYQIPIDFYVFTDFVSGDGCRPIYTPAGSNVVVHVTDYLTLTFSEVTTAGLTTVTTSSNGPASGPSFVLLPSGTPLYYEIQTTAGFVPPVGVCFTYDPALDPAPACPFPMRLGHYDGASWVDVTTEWDCNAYLVCGEVNTLSPFALGQSTCVCDCHGDPGGNCDGDPTVLDVVSVVNSAFRNIAPTPDPSASCPYYPVDVDCSHSIDVLDVVKLVSVTFRNANPATEFRDPCAP